METVVVPLGRSKMLLLLGASLLFVFAGAWIFGLDAAEIAAQRRYNNPLIMHGAGMAAMMLGGLGAIVMVRKLVDRRPGLVLDAHGLTDNSSAVSAGLIPWRDIAGFEVHRIQGQRLLYVLLHDPDAYIARCGPIKRVLLRANQRIAASPIAITSNALSMDFDTVVALTERYLAASRQAV
jgi:hypothetical protein